MIKNIFSKFFKTRNERLLKEYYKKVIKINAYSETLKKLSDEELKNKTTEFKDRIKNGETLNSLLVEAFAVCREASSRVLNMRHFDVQLVGGMALFDGKIAEMKTGEGKTLVATLPTYLYALEGKGVHIVTVNDYLAKRDATWMGTLYNFLGLSVGINLPQMDIENKKFAYNQDITYGTNNEFGFDYLKDNMVFNLKDRVQRKLAFAIVDEVDSILIDEARTPLIISGATEGSNELYKLLDKIPQQLLRQKEENSDGDFYVDEKNNSVILSESGHEKVENILIKMNLLKENDSLYNVQNISLMHHLIAALKAHYLFYKDQQYVVQNGEVVIVDEFTGRLMQGRRWSDGLHQAVEAKENVAIQKENQTLATITFQNYFRLYEKLAGMTGTADTEAFEFQQIYNLETVVIPTNKPNIRKDFNDKIYMTQIEKYNAIIDDIKIRHEKKQPILLGTTSVENSEVLSKMLAKNNIRHEVLNAKYHLKEAEIIEDAGKLGAITVATNMAGRGTDIKLGGNISSKISAILNNDSLKLKEQEIAAIKNDWQEEHNKVIALGGLYIIGSERHESRRIDNQLRGRSARQGDPGETRFYLSLEDPLLRIFGGQKMRSLMERLGIKQNESIEHKWLSRSIESAQRKVEGHNFDIRKQLLDYDNVANEQRKVIYEQRDDILKSEDLTKIVHNIIISVLSNVINNHCNIESSNEDWDLDTLFVILKNEFSLSLSKENFKDNLNLEELKEKIISFAIHNYESKMDDFVLTQDISLKNFIESLNSIADDKKVIILLNEFCIVNNIKLDKSIDDYTKENNAFSIKDYIEYFKNNLNNLGLLQKMQFERNVVLQHIDYYWIDHLTHLEQLRQGIYLRSYAQKDPKQEYKHEAFNLFASMLESVKVDIVKSLLTVRMSQVNHLQEENSLFSNFKEQLKHEEVNVLNDNAKKDASQSRNSVCNCGSGKKYKHCCGKLA